MKVTNRIDQKNKFDGNFIYGAHSFNKKTGRDTHFKNRLSKKNDDITDPITGKLRQDISKNRKCPLCSKDKKTIIFIKEGFEHYKCQNCSMVYVNPILNEEKLHNFYQDEESYNKVLTNSLQIDLDIKRFNYCLDIIEQYCPKKGNILDVGAGAGIFLEVAMGRNWEPLAIEFNSFCIKRIKSLGIDCISKPIEEVNLPKESFDCITLWAVLEHLQEPKKMLKNINELLKPNGILVILVPNINSLAARIMHEKCGTFSGDAHINFFNDMTLKNIQEKAGFKVLEVETVFSEVNTIKNYLNYNDPYFGKNNHDDFAFLNTKYIHDNLLGYCLITYATKQKLNEKQ